MSLLLAAPSSRMSESAPPPPLRSNLRLARVDSEDRLGFEDPTMGFDIDDNHWASIESTPIQLNLPLRAGSSDFDYSEVMDLSRENSAEKVDSSIAKHRHSTSNVHISSLTRHFYLYNHGIPFASSVSSSAMSLGEHVAPRPPPPRASIQLTMTLLEQISNSIHVFRPSKSLAEITQTEAKRKQQLSQLSSRLLYLDGGDINSSSNGTGPGGGVSSVADIDIVISGGGLKGYFMAGASAILQKELIKNNVKIARVAGASAGAWAGMFLLTGVTTTHWLETYYACLERDTTPILEVYKDLWEWFRHTMPKNAYVMCSGKLFISLTVLSNWGTVTNKIISTFDNNDELFEVCMASSCIPYLTTNQRSWLFRGEHVLDGGITNNTPVFTDGVRRQLVFRLFDVEYPWRLLVSARDSCIDALVLRGAILMARFLEGEKCDAIAWLEKSETKVDLTNRYVRPNYSARVVLAPLTVFLRVIYMNSGLPRLGSLLTGLFSTRQGSSSGGDCAQVVPFHDAQKEFGGSSTKYVMGALYASLVDFLRRIHLLL